MGFGPPRTTGSGDRAATTPVGAGRRPRVRRSASATAAIEGVDTPSSRMGAEHLPIAEGLAGAVRDHAQTGWQSREPLGPRRPGRSTADHGDAKRWSRSACTTTGRLAATARPSATAWTGNGLHSRSETGKRAARPEGYLQGPDDPPAVGRLDSRWPPHGVQVLAGAVVQPGQAVSGLKSSSSARTSGIAPGRPEPVDQGLEVQAGPADQQVPGGPRPSIAAST